MARILSWAKQTKISLPRHERGEENVLGLELANGGIGPREWVLFGDTQLCQIGPDIIKIYKTGCLKHQLLKEIPSPLDNIALLDF